MQIKKTVCDRCGVDIEERYPDRMQLEHHEVGSGYTGARYIKDKTIELCSDCRKAFDSFMRGGIQCDK